MEKQLALRTRFFTVLLEDIYKPQNASAVMRTCDCLGIQDLYMVEDKHRLSTYSNVELGASKWITLKRYRSELDKNIGDCFNDLRKNNYRICATYLGAGSTCLQDYKIQGKTCFVFGTEQEGISEFVKSESDDLVQIPMVGFTDSLNLSVSVGIILNSALEKARAIRPDMQLDQIEKDELRLSWYKKVVRGADKILNV